MKIEQVPASESNYTKGRMGSSISQIIIHEMEGTLSGTDSWFANSAARVSAHYGIGKSGVVHQYVSEDDVAWHSGNWHVNQHSIGIEHEGKQPDPHPPYWEPTAEQSQASVKLVADICKRHKITPTLQTIRRHSEINPLHALCPGPGWDMDNYINAILDELAGRAREPIVTPVRLFDPSTNKQLGVGSLVDGTDKVYIKKMF